MVTERSFFVLLGAGFGLAVLWSCGPDPAHFSTACAVDDDCGTARLDACSSCITHAFTKDDAELATEEAQSAFCPFGVRRCDGLLLVARCEDATCVLEPLEE